MTLRALNEARTVVFLVTGAAKTKRLAQVLAERIAPPSADALPASRVQPVSHGLHFYVDQAAMPQSLDPA
jgi:6-phosphogluconolactonase/glucosamine-6-phosphate isomerase/deaminase